MQTETDYYEVHPGSRAGSLSGLRSGSLENAARAETISERLAAMMHLASIAEDGLAQARNRVAASYCAPTTTQQAREPKVQVEALLDELQSRLYVISDHASVLSNRI